MPINDTSCPLCNEDNESADHLFGDCSFAQQVWLRLLPPMSFNWSAGYANVFKSLFIDQVYDQDLFERMIVTCWAIWRMRNDKIFRGNIPNPSKVLSLVADYLKKHDVCNTPKLN